MKATILAVATIIAYALLTYQGADIHTSDSLEKIFLMVIPIILGVFIGLCVIALKVGVTKDNDEIFIAKNIPAAMLFLLTLIELFIVELKLSQQLLNWNSAWVYFAAITVPWLFQMICWLIFHTLPSRSQSTTVSNRESLAIILSCVALNITIIYLIVG